MTEVVQPLDQNSEAIIDSVSLRIARESGSEKLRVADVGCGEGRLLHRLYQLGIDDLTGIGWQIQVPAQAELFERIDLSMEGWSKRLNGNKFDWLVSTEVLEHLVNPFQFLLELRELISPNGRLLLTFPNVHNLRSIFGYALRGRFSGFFGPNFNNGHPLHDQHIFIPNQHLVRYFLRLTGFSVTETAWINGGHRLTAQTAMIVAEPGEPTKIT